MIVSNYYYEVLGVKPGERLDAVKKSFRTLVRKNHPDLFPEPLKGLQELKMIQINEAYAMISRALEPVISVENERVFRTEPEGKAAWYRGAERNPQNAVAFHRDIQYAYYKQGFENFSKALNGIKGIERKVSLRNDFYYLRRFSASLINLRKADTYFSKLLEEHPESMWAPDAYIKIRKIEYFSRLYRKILTGIEKKLKTGQEPAA
jgi:outer membrane protein assembly factor BamD (BamD/ComL family)